MLQGRVVVSGVVALASLWMFRFVPDHVLRSGSIAGHTMASREGPSALVRSLRPSYPYSIVPGGAYSPTELRVAQSKDPVVRKHYLDFDVKQAKLVRLVDDRYQYVSYRVREQVYWTKQRLRIPRGELLLTDRCHYARARCGNRLSDTPHKDLSAQEPPTSALSLPPVSTDLLPELTLSSPPESEPLVPDSRTAATIMPLMTKLSLPEVFPDHFYTSISPVVGDPSTAGSFPATGGGVSSRLRSSPALPDNSDAAVSMVQSPPDPESPTNTSPIPEPATMYLFIVIVVFAGWSSFRKSHKIQAKIPQWGP